MQKNELKQQLCDAEIKLKEYHKWLIDHTADPYFAKVAGDRRNLLIKKAAIEYKINQLEKGLPILGEPEELTVRVIPNISNNQINKIT